VSRRSRGTALGLLLLGVALCGPMRASMGAGSGDDEGDEAIAPRKVRRPRLMLYGKKRPIDPAEGNEDTHCAACHIVEGWEKVRFNHDPTGFPLRGNHVDVTCGGCHKKDFETPIADTCAGCHRDRHAGELGMHCEGCHDEKSWRPLFNAEAHRRTNFPLVGKHALIPCTECHGNVRDRTFAHAAVRCDACHEADFLRTALTSIDHAANNFSRECQTCHDTLRFFPATVRAHDGCFRISGGPHQGIRCLGCHTSLPTSAFNGTCTTGTFTCAECHTHACARSDLQHKNVLGYACADPKCYECHTNGHQ